MQILKGFYIRIRPKYPYPNLQLLLQVDFANKMVGGGVLGQGLVQEEIRLVEEPKNRLSEIFLDWTMYDPEPVCFFLCRIQQ